MTRGAHTETFAGFRREQIDTVRGVVNAIVGGSGPPWLLLHGYPQTHRMWHGVAALLAEHHTVVATDLAGYGASFRPTPTADHSAHSKRTLALDQVETMQVLGFDRFSVAGHDRGGRVVYRMALDHPGLIDRLAVLDIVPTGEVWRRADRSFAQAYWHWAFLSLDAPLPERLIGGDPDAFFTLHVQRQMGLGREPGRYPTALLDEYRRLLDDSGAVAAMCEEYRAGATIDVDHDDADRAAGRRVECPTLALWAERGVLPRLYGDVLDVWRPWAEELRGASVDASHFLAEDRPDDVAAHLLAFTT